MRSQISRPEEQEQTLALSSRGLCSEPAAGRGHRPTAEQVWHLPGLGSVCHGLTEGSSLSAGDGKSQARPVAGMVDDGPQRGTWRKLQSSGTERR